MTKTEQLLKNGGIEFSGTVGKTFCFNVQSIEHAEVKVGQSFFFFLKLGIGTVIDTHFGSPGENKWAISGVVCGATGTTIED